MMKLKYILSILYLFIMVLFFSLSAVVGGSLIISSLLHIPIWVAPVIYVLLPVPAFIILHNM